MINKEWGHPRFYEILDEIAELHSNKNHDYAGEKDPLANFRECERLGLSAFQGCFVRMQDKYMRLLNFIKSGTFHVKGEGVIDTLRDLAVYSLIASILYEEEHNEKT